MHISHAIPTNPPLTRQPATVTMSPRLLIDQWHSGAETIKADIRPCWVLSDLKYQGPITALRQWQLAGSTKAAALRSTGINKQLLGTAHQVVARGSESEFWMHAPFLLQVLRSTQPDAGLCALVGIGLGAQVPHAGRGLMLLRDHVARHAGQQQRRERQPGQRRDVPQPHAGALPPPPAAAVMSRCAWAACSPWALVPRELHSLIAGGACKQSLLCMLVQERCVSAESTLMAGSSTGTTQLKQSLVVHSH